MAEHLDTVIEKAGGVDISFNTVGLRNTTLQGVPLVDLDVEELMRPVDEHVRALPDSGTIEEVFGIHAKAHGITREPSPTKTPGGARSRFRRAAEWD